MKFLQCLAVVAVLWSAPCLAGEIQRVSLPKEVRHELRTSTIPKEIEGKVWNRWTTENFVVCSLDDRQAQYLHKHLEFVKAWAFSRWGLYDVNFAAECKLICVNDPDLFEKMFRIKKTKVEVRRDTNGRIKESVIFLLVNDSPSRTVPVPLSEICIAEFAQKYDANFGWWAYRGVSLLNASIDQVKSDMNQLGPAVNGNQPIYFSKGLMEMTQAEYQKLDSVKKRLFDHSAMAFCLLVRKELGQDTFHRLLKKTSDNKGEAGIKEILNFESYDHFDRTFKRYMIDLTADMAQGKTPDSYLQIREKVR
jgi:hypothetical protein